ncbi:MAG: hypothetical protein BTN85_1264 [Candidatus Methanohalarchaeum thermophilum]|uniref:Uncharacterized protein n=1 Tax=Methanohalarchaeum thermophilum TaxID=1903181 RepID=A0A1Q6DWM1_METT1|nr:MAG: hypothetical protein BTN85_1264 [Candidatus Methanohalarchaeum thermophilum]
MNAVGIGYFRILLTITNVEETNKMIKACKITSSPTTIPEPTVELTEEPCKKAPNKPAKPPKKADLKTPISLEKLTGPKAGGIEEEPIDKDINTAETKTKTTKIKN